MIDIKVPALGESVTEATVVAILKKSGDYVEKGAEVFELETDKVNSVVTAPESGKIEIAVNLEQKVKAGDCLAKLEIGVEPKEKSSAPPPSKKEAPPASLTPREEQTPSARLLKEDFFKEAPSKSEEKIVSPAPQKERKSPFRKKMSSLRKAIATHLVRVKNETAMLTTFNEVDMTEIMAIREREKDNFVKKHGVKLGFMSFFIQAVVSASKTYKEVTASIEGEDIVYPEGLNIGIAVSTEKGLVVPVIRECETKSFAKIEKELAELAEKARKGSLSLDDLKGGCFTITNGGVFGSLLSTPIINAGQSAILGMHSIQKRAVVIEDEIVIRPMMYLALSYDHRIIDGKEAIGFLLHLKEHLEQPSRFLFDF